MIKTDKNHKFHTRASTPTAQYLTTHGPVPVHGPGVGDRCSKVSMDNLTKNVLHKNQNGN